jgi:hypothetical protein
MSTLSNQIRFYNFISGVFIEQQSDPLCQNCKAFANSVEGMKEGLSELKNLLRGKVGDIAPEILPLLDNATIKINRINVPENAIGQKKAGRCGMPEGVCFIKIPKGIRERV